MTDRSYLRANVVIEPLVERWYAWAHLLSPATAAMNVLNRHVVNMRSYIRAPAVHDAAARDPAMIGGPFFLYDRNRVADVQALLDRTLERQAKQLELAAAIHGLAGLLEKEADGGSLEHLYDLVQEPLRGFVELVYDLDHRPGFRLIEPLLYASEYRTDAFQQLALYPIGADHERDFILSTPRLSGSSKIFVDIPFADPAIDLLARARSEPVDVAALADRLNVAVADRTAFAALFTPERGPPLPPPVEPGEVRIRYFGHACVLIETEDCSILTDPVLSYGYDTPLPRYTWADLPARIDYVILTHNHQDHVLCETLLQLRHRVGTVIVPHDSGGDLQDPSLRLMLRNLGFAKVVALSELEALHAGGVTITGVPFMGEHGDLDVRSKLCFMIDTGPKTILLAIDTRVVDRHVYERVRDLLGPADIVFLGMECAGAPLSYLYAPLMTNKINRDDDEERRLNGSGFDQARRLVDSFAPSEVYIYALGHEPWLQYIMGVGDHMQSEAMTESDRLIDYCATQGKAAARLFGQREWMFGASALTEGAVYA